MLHLFCLISITIQKVTNIEMSSTLDISSPQEQKKSIHQKRLHRRREKEMKELQERTSILPASTFKRIVKKEAAKHSTVRLRFNADAIVALQTATEQELTTIFSGAAVIAGIANRQTIVPADMVNFIHIRDL
jgi:histone H3/H4